MIHRNRRVFASIAFATCAVGGAVIAQEIGARAAESSAATSSVGTIDVSNQFFSGPLQGSITGISQPAPAGLWYVVVPTAANRTYADFEVLCDGNPTVTIANLSVIPGGNQACTSEIDGVRTITVRDRLGAYPTATVQWLRNGATGGSLLGTAGVDLLIPVPPGATEVTLNGQACATTCTLPGSSLAVTPNPAARPRAELRYRIGGVPGGVTYFVDVRPAPTLAMNSPSVGVFGQAFTVQITTPSPVGRVDVRLGAISVGSASVGSNGVASLTVVPWQTGDLTITADWVRYVGGAALVDSISAPINVRTSTDVPTTTIAPPPTTVAPPPTTIAPPPTTIAPPPSGFAVSAPSSVRFGSSFRVQFTGAMGGGRIDLRIGSQPVGSFVPDATGSVTATVSAWTSATSIHADWVRYVNGAPVTVTASTPIVITT